MKISTFFKKSYWPPFLIVKEKWHEEKIYLEKVI